MDKREQIIGCVLAGILISIFIGQKIQFQRDKEQFIKMLTEILDHKYTYFNSTPDYYNYKDWKKRKKLEKYIFL